MKHQTESLQSTLVLSSAVNDDVRGRETITHELLHVCFAEWRELFNNVLKLAPDQVQLLAAAQGTAIEERTVSLMARMLSRAFENIKVSEEEDDAED